MTLREFIEKNLIHSYWSFDLDQIDAYRIIDKDGYEEYTYEEMLSSHYILFDEKIAFVAYDPRNSTMNIFLED
jgi:hypothetical protein